MILNCEINVRSFAHAKTINSRKKKCFIIINRDGEVYDGNGWGGWWPVINEMFRNSDVEQVSLLGKGLK